MNPRAMLLVVACALGGVRVVAAEPPPDAEFLEFLGSVDGDEGFDGFLRSRDLPIRSDPTTTEARPAAADSDDQDTP